MLTWRLALHLDPGSGDPVFLQIARAIGTAVSEGRLKPGSALPGTRALAEQLDVNRNTVVAAFQELAAEGWIVSRVGGGTFVADPPPGAARRTAQPEPHPMPFAVNQAPSAPAAGPCAASVLSCLTGEVDPRLLPMMALARAYQRATRTHDPAAFSQEHPQGREPLRKALGDMLATTKGLPARPDTLLILSGLNEAFSLLCRTLLQPGDTVLVEALGSPAHWEALRLGGARLAPVPVDGGGVQVEALRGMLEATRARMVLLTPVRQYPSTVPLLPERRRQVLALAGEHHAAVLELDTDPGFQFEGPPLLPLASEDPAGRVIHLGAFSRLLFPNLPIAYIHADPGLIQSLAGWRQALSHGGDPFLELALADLMQDGELQRHLLRLRKSFLERRDALASALQRHLDGVLDVLPPSGGQAFWLRALDERLDVAAWSARGLKGGVAFRAGQQFTFDGRAIPWLRMGFGSLSCKELAEAAVRMAAAL
jgi:GntR family transcriptional regulator/MocR family aminotransferase